MHLLVYCVTLKLWTEKRDKIGTLTCKTPKITFFEFVRPQDIFLIFVCLWAYKMYDKTSFILAGFSWFLLQRLSEKFLKLTKYS